MTLRAFLTGSLAAALCAATVSAQKTYTPKKTAWGDPDLQGIYTNKDENGIPFERPSQLAGKNAGDVNDDELKDLIEERAKAAVERAPGIGGADTGAGPTHWYEHYGAKNSRAWLLVDPPDGANPGPDGKSQCTRGRPRSASQRTRARRQPRR